MCFFFNDTATTEIYTLSLHDALPIYDMRAASPQDGTSGIPLRRTIEEEHDAHHYSKPARGAFRDRRPLRSEEHKSELQSRQSLVCRLLLEKKIPQHPRTPHQAHLLKH